MFSLKESDACLLGWNDDLKTCLNEPNTFLIDGGCYLFVDEYNKFYTAKSYCEGKNGRLFEPRSEETNMLVFHKASEVGLGEYAKAGC